MLNALPSVPTVVSNAVIPAALIMVAASGLLNLPGIVPLNPDTIWLIEVAEQVLAGKVLYRDVIETNPPLSVLLYMPAVAVARGLGVPSESAVAIYTFACATAFASLSTALLAASGHYRNSQLVLIGFGLCVLMALMPKFIATQREHFAAMAALPFVLLAAQRIGNEKLPGLSLRLAAAAGGAICICIKPYFGLALALPVLGVCLAKRSIGPLFYGENWVAVAMVLAFTLSALLIFPHYITDVLPIVLDVYAAQRIPLAEYLVSPISQVFYLLSLVAVPALMHPFARGPAAIVLLSAVGFFIAFLIQGKGWSYHLYPAIHMLGLAVLLAQFPRGASAGETPLWRTLRLSSLTLIAAALAMLFVKVPTESSRLQAVLAAVEKPASALIVTEYHELIFPAVRQAGLAWASRTNGTWLAENAIRQMSHPGKVTPAQQARLDSAIATLRRWLREDTAAMRPEIIVFHHSSLIDWDAFAREDTAFATIMQDYQLIDSFIEAGVHRLKVYRRIGEKP